MWMKYLQGAILVLWLALVYWVMQFEMRPPFEASGAGASFVLLIAGAGLAGWVAWVRED